jgi:hypothetical protein
MTDPFSLTHRHGRKLPRRRARQRTFLKAPGEAGSVVPAASIVDAGRTTPCTWRNTLPGFVFAGETLFVNESLGDSRPMSRLRQMRRESMGWQQARIPVATETGCLTDSAQEDEFRFARFCRARRVPETPGKANENREVRAFGRTPDLHGS